MSELLKIPSGDLMEFEVESNNQTVYNPSVPFLDNGRHVILARRESLDAENDSQAVLFDLESGCQVEGAPVLDQLQDPYHLGMFLDGDGSKCQVIGGVRIFTDEQGNIINYKDVFYKYKNSINELVDNSHEAQPFAEGIDHWKDTRFIQLHDRVAVFPRPQQDFGGKGRIGYFETSSIDTLGSDLRAYATEADKNTLLPGLFEDDEWGGANQLLLRDDGVTIDVIGHRAWRNEKNMRDYEAIHFAFNRLSRLPGPVSVIARATDFEYVKPKVEDLNSVVFTAGIVPTELEGVVDLYVGVGDVRVGRVRIKDPRI
jgi:hypothetical protein